MRIIEENVKFEIFHFTCAYPRVNLIIRWSNLQMEKVRQANLRGCSVTPVAQRSIRQTRNPRLLDQLKEALRSRRYSRRTEQTYCQDGKGTKDRITMLPESLKTPLQDHLKHGKSLKEWTLSNFSQEIRKRLIRAETKHSASYADQSNHC